MPNMWGTTELQTVSFTGAGWSRSVGIQTQTSAKSKHTFLPSTERNAKTAYEVWSKVNIVFSPEPAGKQASLKHYKMDQSNHFKLWNKAEQTDSGHFMPFWFFYTQRPWYAAATQSGYVQHEKALHDISQTMRDPGSFCTLCRGKHS